MALRYAIGPMEAVIPWILVVGCTPAGAGDRPMGDEERGTLSVDVAATVQDSAVSGIVGAEGGALELPGVARVTFPAGAFAAPERIVLAMTDHPQSVEGIGMFEVSGGLPQT